MSRPIHFEILADEPEKIGDFYKKIFNWEISTWGEDSGYWLIKTGPEDSVGVDGAIMGREFKQAVINTHDVEDLDATIKMVEAGGGKLVHGPNQVSTVGLHAYCADPEGNLFGVMQLDSE